MDRLATEKAIDLLLTHWTDWVDLMGPPPDKSAFFNWWSSVDCGAFDAQSAWSLALDLFPESRTTGEAAA